MEVGQILVSELQVGDVIGTTDDVGWWSVSEVDQGAAAGTVDLVVQSIHTDQIKQRRLPGDQCVRRIQPAAVHHKDEFLGMTVDHAEMWAAALGWRFRNYSASGTHTDEEPHNRIDVWTDQAGIVIRTKKY